MGARPSNRPRNRPIGGLIGTIAFVRNRATEAFDKVTRRMGLRDGPVPGLPRPPAGPVPPLEWHAQEMVPLVDLRNRDAVIAAMEGTEAR